MTSTLEVATSRNQRKELGPYTFATYQNTGNSGTATSSDTKAGSKNPSWRSQVRSCVNATTGYSRTIVRDGLFYGRITATYEVEDYNDPGAPRWSKASCIDYEVVGNNPRLGPPSLQSMSNLDSDVRIKFLAKCRAARSSFQTGVFLGELRETIHQIVRPASALRRAVSLVSVKSKKTLHHAKTLKQGLKVVSGSWLEFAYGVRPLISDIDDAMATLAQKGTLYPEVVSAQSGADWYSFKSSDVNAIPGSLILYNRQYRDLYNQRIRYKGAVAWESKNLAGEWRSDWGLTTSQFVPTIYELIPYSFLVDYFSTLGQVIDAASYGSVGLHWGVKSETNRATRQVLQSASVLQNQNGVRNQKIQDVAVRIPPLSRMQFIRSIVSNVSVDFNDIHLRCPGVDSTKWLNIAALATEAVFRK